MPSRQPPPSPPPAPPPSAAPPFLAAFSLLLLLTLCFPRRRNRPRTAPSLSSPKPAPHPFPYRTLRRATSHFSPSHLLGRGGFGSVYRATLRDPTRHVAVKSMDPTSLQGEREFHNELLFAPVTSSSPHILHVIGFSSDPPRHRLLLVYDLMPRGSLQDCLLHKKSPELTIWSRRFRIVLDVAKGIEFLHHGCGNNNVIIHGDIKPSNILLDEEFRARIGDFGLARMRENGGLAVIESGREGKGDGDENGSNFGESEGLEEFGGPSHSPETFRDPETMATDKGSLSEGNFDKASIGSGRRAGKSRSGKDWWWKQENIGVNKEGIVKDYVMEWLGSEINKDKLKNNYIGGSSMSSVGKSEKKIKKKRLDWWMAMDDEKDKKRERRRPAREWWKEEYCEELAKKKKKKMKKKGLDGYNSENLRPIDDEMYVDRSKRREKKKRRESRSGSRGSDSASVVSSTPSMRGTVCYAAPEYNRDDNYLSEKCDVYSFGVFLLVLVSGRRPLQVTGSPISEFQRANLLSWSRHLARSGKLLDLVDKEVEAVDEEQAILCIIIALLCIQKSPSKRPSMREIVGMLSGELDSPKLPVEFSPSPPCQFPFKSKKGPVSF